MVERVMIGHFLTRGEAAHRAVTGVLEIQQRPDLLRIRGGWLEETYFEFQFLERGVHREMGRVVLLLKERFTDIAIADWMARPNQLLGDYSPLRWLETGQSGDAVLEVARANGPVP